MGDHYQGGGRKQKLRRKWGQTPRGRWDRDSGQKLKPRPGKTYGTTDWGAGAPCHQESQNKGPRRPLPQFPTTPIRGGAGQRGNLPSSPRPHPLLSPPPVSWARIQLKFPVTFRRPETGENFFQYSQIPPPWQLHVFHSFPRTPESRLSSSSSSLGPWKPGQDRQRPQAEPSGAAAFRTPVGQNPSPAFPHVARQRDGGAG